MGEVGADWGDGFPSVFFGVGVGLFMRVQEGARAGRIVGGKNS